MSPTNKQARHEQHQWPDAVPTARRSDSGPEDVRRQWLLVVGTTRGRFDHRARLAATRLAGGELGEQRLVAGEPVELGRLQDLDGRPQRRGAGAAVDGKVVIPARRRLRSFSDSCN
jgi:hypothetical protein